LIASKGREGYVLKDLVSRMQEISQIKLRKTISRAVSSIYDSEWVELKMQKNKEQVKKIVINTQKHRDSIVNEDQKKMFTDVLQVGTKGNGKISVTDMEAETGLEYKDCLRYARGERSAFRRDLKSRYDNKIKLAVFLGRHISTTEWAKKEMGKVDIKLGIKGLEKLLTLLIMIYQAKPLKQIDESVSKKILGLEFVLSSIWMPVYWINQARLLDINQEEIINGVWNICYRDIEYINCGKGDVEPLLSYFGENSEFDDVFENNFNFDDARKLRGVLQNKGNKEFSQLLSIAAGKLFASMWDKTRILINEFESEWKRQDNAPYKGSTSEFLLLEDKKIQKKLIEKADGELFEGFY